MTAQRPVFISLRCALVYGPMHRWPGGSTLGVNPLPPDRKTCNFNCAHCPYGRTPPDALDCPESAWPSTGQVVDALEHWFARAPRRGARIDRLLLAGHGEPTLHPRFPAIVAAVADVRARFAPHARLAVLSNGTAARDPGVRAALACLDDRYIKLDARASARPGDQPRARQDFGAIVDGLRHVADITIRSVFAVGPEHQADNSTDAAVEPWLETVASVWPRAVEICTLEGPTASPWLEKVSRHRLNQIAHEVRRLGIAAEVFG